MLKKGLLTLVVGALVLGAGSFMLKNQATAEPTAEAAPTAAPRPTAKAAPKERKKPKGPKNMFVSEDADEFDPGIEIGESFPAIKAVHKQQTITSITPFMRDKGMIFIANRSTSW